MRRTTSTPRTSGRPSNGSGRRSEELTGFAGPRVLAAEPDERLARAARFLRHCTRPDGTIPALSDADSGDLDPTADLLADEGQEPRLGGRRGPHGRSWRLNGRWVSARA
jgi:hypothetical protein